MDISRLLDPHGEDGFRILWECGEHIYYRGSRENGEGAAGSVLFVLPASERPTSAALDRLDHEYKLRDELEADWAARPVEFARDHGRLGLILEDPGGEPLERLIGEPIEPGRFLYLAVGVAAALAKAHQRGLVHKDIKPAHILVNCTDGRTRLTGFGIASRLPRERQAPEPLEVIAGTLAYMAPEQTGRMNRSVDSRADLYALGVTYYHMLTGRLPFSAADPMEWVHCHIARKPLPPAERSDSIPVVISDIVIKLLAKTAEERYQTAVGVEHDLRRCLAEWERHGRLERFALGERDQPDRLMIPEKLYGREREVEALVTGFHRVSESGASELVLISGYSGIGKSSVVNELHKALMPRGLFASGKFDQHKRDIPYATLVQAFRGLVRLLLGKGGEELVRWREALLEALGPNARLISDLVPELTLIIGEPPLIPEIELQQQPGRFQLVLRRLIGVFARSEHPLVLFLDDLQWIDAATLDLLEDLLSQAGVQHVLLIGAYRDNEVDSVHPLMRKLMSMRRNGAMVCEISLGPLSSADTGRLIAEALRMELPDAAPLSQLVQEKTAGNPFFVLQFLYALADEGLLCFDHQVSRWSWDLERIYAKRYTDNVVSLMLDKLVRLRSETQNALQHLACLGNAAELSTFAIIYGSSEDEAEGDLWQAARLELVERRPGGYRFAHDRVQEAAYSLIPEERRAETHLRIGRLLLANTPPEKCEDAIFDIVNQLNRGAALIASLDERERLAELNLKAGKRAKASAAYASALKYLTTGAALLPADGWERRAELAFALDLNRAECEFLTGDLVAADERLAELSRRAAGAIDHATIACLRADIFTALDRSGRAVEVCLDCLRHFGVDLPPHPTETVARRVYELVRSRLDSCTIDELVARPLMTDPESLTALDVLTKLSPSTLFTDANLNCLITCKAVELSLDHGNSDGSSVHYVWLGCLAGAQFGDYGAGYKFGRVGYELVEERGLTRFQARTYVVFGGLLVNWTRHLRAGREPLRRAFEIANRIGDLNFASYSRNNLNVNLIAAGDPLGEVRSEVEFGLEFARKLRFGLTIDIIATQLGLVRTLLGLNAKFGSLDHEHLDGTRIERRFSENPGLAIAECWYWIRKLQACFFAGDYAMANECAGRAKRLLWTSPGQFEMAEYHFYAALSLAAACDRSSFVELQRASLEAHRRQLEIWAENCPENFENRAALVGAEMARLEARDIDAERLYERAIRSARENGFVHNEAIAYQRASTFYRERGFAEFADLYMRNARYGYVRWGADGMVRRLDEFYPHLAPAAAPAPTGTIIAPVESLDLATVIKVSQAISGEIVLDKLVDTLMRTAIEQAGAERGLLILPRGTEQRIAAEATTVGDAVMVRLRDEVVAEATLPQSVLHYVVRTRESVTVDDAAAQSAFAEDPYIRERDARSILCVPLINQTRLTGVLYLENNLARGAFAPARTATLKLLASQAAIALENNSLYRDLAEREAKIRRLVESDIIGICIWQMEGQILDANDAFLRMLGYQREDLVAGRLRWTDMTPPEWTGRNAQTVQEIRMTGTAKPFEKEYVRKDGGRVPVLIGSASFEEGSDQGVAFVLDLTERKRAETEARESERRHRETQTQLAHANRVATMGQLTASIAHEVNQPIAATVTNAHSALHWLDADPPNLDEARQALGRIVRDGGRAGAVISRTRALIKRAPPRGEHVDVNAAIREVIELTRAEAMKSGVSMRTDLSQGLPLVYGDRVELQQVVLNLILNAVEAMSGIREGSRELLITTGTTKAGDMLVAVSDSGPGLAPDIFEHLFQAFFTTKPNGLGLGLSICRSIVEARGGKLWASAESPRGAVFQFTLPIEPDDGAEQQLQFGA